MAVGGAPGLYLRAGTKPGTGKFFLRYTSPQTGKRRDMGLGAYPEIGLAKVRKLAIEAREKIAGGVDPIAEREEAKAVETAQLSMPSFRAAAEAVHATLAPGFRNTKHAAQWISTLETFIFPKLGTRPVDSLKLGDFAAALRPIWLTKAETASRVKQRCDRVMIWCVAHG